MFRDEFEGGLVFKVHGLVYHSTLGLRVIKKKKKKRRFEFGAVGRKRGLVEKHTELNPGSLSKSGQENYCTLVTS